MSVAPIHTGEVGTIQEIKVHEKEPIRHAKKAAFDPYAYSRAKLAARQAADALEIQQSAQAALESERLNLDMAVIRCFLLRECKYDPSAGVDLSELQPQGPMPRHLPPMDPLARSVKFGVVTIMAGGVK